MTKIYDNFDPYQTMIEQQIRIEQLEQNLEQMHLLVKQHHSAMLSQHKVIQELMHLTVTRTIQGE